VRFVEQRLSDHLSNGYERSALARIVTVVRSWVVASWLYRWLTTEPEPGEIVIDLRESVFVRPFLDVIAGVWPRARATGARSQLVTMLAETEATFEDDPVTAGSFVVLVATVVNTAVTGLIGDLSAVGVVVRAVVIAGALLGLRLRGSPAMITDSRVIKLARATIRSPEADLSNEDDGDVTERNDG
jgi:hypothetical protein